MKKSMKFIIYFTCSILLISSSHAGINSENSKKWVNINESFFIDTKSFNIESPYMFFWIRNKNYNKRRLSINCASFEERERYKGQKTEWQPIFRKTPKYKILNQLCFLTDDTNFRKENRPPLWAKNIIENYQKGIFENNKELKKNVLDNSQKNKKQLFVE